MASDDLVSLPTLYARAVTAVTSATEPWPALTYLAHAEEPVAPNPSNPPSERAEEAISTVKSLSGILHAAAVLSSNEDLDEIATRNLKYLITPYLSALALQAWQGKPADRLEKLNGCMQYLQLFFDSMHKLRLLSERERDSVLDNTVDATLTPAEKRETKIVRFKMEKVAEKKLKYLMERLQKREQEDDEEGEREAYLVVLESAVRKALDLHAHIQTEMELLSYAEQMRRRGIDPSEHAQRSRPRGPIPGMKGMPSTFQIVNEREKIRDGVFRPSHSLPTYTVEEWGEIEAKRLREVEQEKKRQEEEERRRKEGEDSDGDEVVDRETMEARRWDAWKDDHNKGSGNTIR